MRGTGCVPRVAAALLVASVAMALAVESPSAAGQGAASRHAGERTCPPRKLRVANGCAAPAAAARHIVSITHEAIPELGIKAVIVRVDRGRHTLTSFALGRSMAGVPASPRMHFRIGSIAIPYLINLILQLQDRGRLSLDDELSTYLPKLPNADGITLRMLADNTSGYPDWIQGNDEFVKLLYANVFRQWTPRELLAHAFSRPLACDPGACFNYAHTNFAVLAKVVHKVTGQPVSRLLRKRVLRPLGLRRTAISRLPRIPPPVLHSYDSGRGQYEDATFWSPSWTLGAGQVMTATIGNVARTARAIGTGALISRRARRQQVAPTTVGLPGMRRRLYYGLGLVVANRWRVQNPVLNGYTGVMAYLPSQRLSIAITATTRKRSSSDGRNYSALLFSRIGAYLAPDHPPPNLPG